jgi:uncharacterized beta-barrel protein YwiB (DUF1934 family)
MIIWPFNILHYKFVLSRGGKLKIRFDLIQNENSLQSNHINLKLEKNGHPT